MGLGGKRDKEKQTEGREVSLCTGVCVHVCAGVGVMGGAGSSWTPAPPQPAALTPSPTPGPARGRVQGR